MNQPGTSSGAIAVTTGVQVVTGPGVLLHSVLKGGTTGNAITVYDGTSTSGLQLASIANVTAGVTASDDFAQGIVFNTGLFVVVSGSNSVGQVVYRIGG